MRRRDVETTAARAPFSSLWISIGAPIIGLTLLLGFAAVSLLAAIAQEQDVAFRKSVAQLVSGATTGAADSVVASALDFAIWNDAFDNITRRWNQRWVNENMYSAVLDGLVVFREDGVVRHVWTREGAASRAHVLAAALASTDRARLLAIAQAAATGHMAARNYVVRDGDLMIVAVAPVSREDVAQRGRGARAAPTDYVAAVVQMNPERLATVATAMNLGPLRFRAGSTLTHTQRGVFLVPVGNHDGATIGAFEMKDLRPGSSAFARRAGGITLGLGVFAALAVLLSHRLVRARMQSLALAQASAEEASRVKSQFLATMSHELRTPLNAVIGYAEILEEDAVSGGRTDDARDLGKIQRAARHLVSVINDILHHARLDAGVLELHPERCDPAVLLEDVRDMLAPAAAANGTQIRIQTPSERLSATLDPVRLRQCLVNLAGNAVKFTHNGEVTLALTVESAPEGRRLCFTVADTGIGMSPADVRRLFQPFFQAESGKRTAHGGTGLGLVITQRLAEAMGGSVHVDSILGQGTVCTLKAPCEPHVARQAA